MTTSNSINNKRIAKNTIFLYLRSFFILLVSLYTSRVLLKELGIEDYGVYNVVGGVVVLFTFLTNAVTSATQRYFTYYLGKNDKEQYQKVYSTSFNVLIVVAVIIILLCETVGLWFVYNKLNIPHERFNAALWVYQFSIFSFVVTFIRTPYIASIIAHEKMQYYAYISVFEYTLKLGIVLLLPFLSSDKLVSYGLLYLVVTIITTFVSYIYCINKFSVCRYILTREKKLFKQIASFSGWTIIGQMAVFVFNQGQSFMVNIFYGVALNATLGIVNQVMSGIGSFVTNFQTSFNPQLTKAYSSNDIEAHKMLLYRASKFSYYLILLIAVPVMFNIDYILALWLKEVPPYTSQFLLLTIISHLINTVSSPCLTSIYAVGKIARYQVCLSMIFLTGLVITYPIIKAGGVPYSIIVINISAQVALFALRLYCVIRNRIIKLREYFIEVLKPIALVSICVLLMMFVYAKIQITIHPLANLFIDTIVLTGCCMLLILALGVDERERKYLYSIVRNKTGHNKR